MIKKIFFIIFFLFFQSQAYSNTFKKDCDDIIADLKKSFETNKDLDLESYFEIYNYGFFIEETFDFKKNEMVFKRSNGHPIVSTFLDLELYNKKTIESGDLIIKINNKNTQNLTDEELDTIFYSTKKNNNASIEFLKPSNNEIIKIDLENKEYSYFLTEPRFQIESINEIDTIRGNFEVYYSFSYDQLLPEIGKLISKYKIFENSQCPLQAEDIEELSIGQTAFKFLNRSKFSEDEIIKEYSIYLEKSEKSKSKVKVQDAVVYSFEEGVAKFRNDFNFKKFPFDKQRLKISLMEMYGLRPAPESSLQFLNNSIMYESLKNYTEKNILKEWKITGFDIKQKTANLVDYDLPSAQFDIFIYIERNFLYYLIKIILPIFLILSLAWYVFWINPKELESRITTSIVCFLALVAYNFVIDNEIPKLGYLTYMDWIIMISYIFCALPTAISISMYRYLGSKKYNVMEINSYVRLIGPILYFSLLIIIGLVVLF